MRRPVTPLLIVLMAGISCSSLLSIPDTPFQIILIVTLLLVLFSWIKKRARLLHSALLVAFFLISVLEMNLYRNPHLGDDHIRNFLRNEKIAAEGIICDSPRISHEKTELMVDLFRILGNGHDRRVSGRVLLNVHMPTNFEYGDVIRFRSKLRTPHNFNNPGSFDYEQHLRFRKVLVRAYIDDPTEIIILRRNMGNTVRMELERFRNRIRKTILTVAPATEGEIIQALILGDQVEIPKDVMEKFNRTGTTHIIAISGFNIGIVAVFSLFLIRWFLTKSEYILLRWNLVRISTCAAIFIIILYTLIAGAGISVVRASIMVVIFMSAILLSREGDLFNTLALAAFLILIISPYSLFDVSFQLSFVAVASLIFLTPRLVALLPPYLFNKSREGMTSDERFWHHLRNALRVIIIFFFASLSATLATLPLILFYFNRLSLITLVANFVVVPILGVIAIPCCLFIILAVPLSSSLADIIIRLCAFLVKISLFFVEWFSSFSWSSIFVPTPSLLEIGAFYLLLISAGYCLDQLIIHEATERPKRALIWKIIPVLLTLFFIVDGIHLYFKSLQKGKLSLTAVDVGQGSAILIRFPGGKRMLVDGGGFFNDRFDVGKYVIAPFLWHERINRIDTVTLTHPHPDHLQGLLFVLENFRVCEVWTNGQWSDSPLYATFQKIMRDRGVVVKVLSDLTPDTVMSGVTIGILNPPADLTTPSPAILPSLPPADNQLESSEESLLGAWPIKKRSRTGESMNDRSLVIKFSFGLWAFLLPGDISGNSELRLVRSAADLRSDVLFVPHHGGFNSSTMPFLEKVKPQVAVISCGPDNTFGFPHADVLRRLEQIKSRVYRTDRDGAVTFVTDGRNLQVSTFRHGSP